MKFIRAIGNYFWNVLKSIGALLWSIAIGLLKRIFLLIYLIISGPYDFALGLVYGTKLLFNTPKQWFPWFGNSLLKILAWVGKIIGKILDILQLGELMDLLFQVVKPNQRTLSPSEIMEAQKVYGQGLTFWQVRIDENSLLAWLGAKYAGSEHMGTTTFHTINFSRKLKTHPGNNDMNWLIHELAHVCQMEHVGVQYIIEALVAQNTSGYQFGGPMGLAGKKLKDFNREQQAEIAAHYYMDVLFGRADPKYYLPFIEEFRNAGKLWF